jgi:pimeloyl-ACP methyl ester carboxylesterase
MIDHVVLTVSGLRSPALMAGDAESPDAIVFVHGNPGSSQDWRALLEQVAPFSRALAVDMPGYGQADKPADFDYTVSGYAKHLGLLIASQRIRRVHLVLHDFGGPWGLTWAAEHLDQVASLTLINIGIQPGYRWHYMARLWRLPIVGELVMAATSRPGMRLAMRHGNPRGLPAPYFAEMYSNFDAATRRAVLKLYRHTNDLGGASDQLARALTPRRLPATVVWGARDPYVPVKYAEMQRQFFDVDRVVILEDSGHWPMVDNPAAVADAVVPFLRRQTQGSQEAA